VSICLNSSAHPEMDFAALRSFQIRNEGFFASSRRSRDCAEAYVQYAAQEIPQIDDEIAEKGHFRMETYC